MAGTIKIGEREVGPSKPSFVIAEVGVNHNGDVGLAHRLIDAAATAGADAVKFQTFTPELLAAPGAPQADYQKATAPATSQVEMLASLALGETAYRELRAHADDIGLTFISSPFDESAVRLLHRLGLPAIKVPSGEVTNHGLLREIAATGAAIVMSTGMCTLEDIDAALEAVGDARERLALLHCVSTYPVEPRDCNLRAMLALRDRYHVPVGWSDHTDGIAVPIAAVALGADIVEKHITVDRSLPGPDHAASIEPDAFRAMVSGIRDATAALGDGIKAPTAAELTMANVARKSLHWRRGLGAGETVKVEDLIALRPGTGIPPSRLGDVVGRRTARETSPGSLVDTSDFDPPWAPAST